MKDSTLIVMTNCGKPCFIDQEDWNLISSYKWYLDKGGYVVTSGQYNIKLHRLIMNAKRDDIVDHINQDKLDNRKCNLRLATKSQSEMNKSKRRGKHTSNFKGVSFHKPRNKWRAHITINGQYRHLGLFDNEVEAAKAYDQEAIRLFGSFACTNEAQGLY